MEFQKYVKYLYRIIGKYKLSDGNHILRAELKLQNGYTEKEFWKFLSQYALRDADQRARAELKNYLRGDFRRFCYTFSLLPNIEKAYNILEIGGNPYYLTALMKRYTNYNVQCSNFFNCQDTNYYIGEQELVSNIGEESIRIPWVNLNIEKNWSEQNLDLVCFCEVFEHMIESPIKALLNINKMLMVGGYLVMTTPNANRLENIAKMIAGANIYDLYSGYGLYGRHNREYNMHELKQLLTISGFQVENIFSSNVHAEYGANYFNINKIMRLIKEIPNRELELGQYIFIRAKKIKDVDMAEAPEWLYRSMEDKFIKTGERAQHSEK